MRRVARLLAQRGALSRRQADVAIQEGRVRANGAPVALGDRAAANATLTLDGRAVAAAPPEPLVWLAYKRRGEAVAAAGGVDASARAEG